MKAIPFTLFCLFQSATVLFGLSEEADQRKELEELRRQITAYEQQIAQKKQKKESVMQYLDNLEKEIDLTAGYLRSLGNDIHKSERLIASYQKNIDAISQDLQKLKALTKKRLVTFYKRRRSKEIELLLTLDSATKIKSWLKYQKLVAEHDRRTYNSLVEKQQQLLRQKELLSLEIYSKEKDFKTKNNEEKRLIASRKKRHALLSELNKDTEILQQRLDEVKEAQDRIRSFITRSEERRLTSGARANKGAKQIPRPPRKSRFSQLKGQLIWPVKGEIISHFGRYKHPVLKTVTDNLGIEIRAPFGSPIYAVDQGIVQAITWQRGRGNIVIINHDDGYYTVYTHMEEIHVEPQQFVDTGQVIGTVGDSGSLNGPVLHFQIWKSTVNLDPEKWLKKPLLTFKEQ